MTKVTTTRQDGAATLQSRRYHERRSEARGWREGVIDCIDRLERQAARLDNTDGYQARAFLDAAELLGKLRRKGMKK